MSFPLKIVPSHHPMGRSGPHLIRVSLSTPESKSETASQSVQPFLHSSRQSVVWHVIACPFPSKLSLFTRGSVPPSNTWFLGSTRLSVPNGISVRSAYLHSSRQTVPILYSEHLFSLNCPSHRGIWAPSNTLYMISWAHPSKPIPNSM